MEKKKQWKMLPIDHVFDPITGEHLPQCKLRDRLYWDIIKNQRSQNNGVIFDTTN